ncbi:hypothetical protein BDQ12DRAFT_729215 [Crucibulum laeve]|uniref:Uncharacterized protein n=1 Tax=Crucibulum laeve TaxID=68775 RepID=A0A5C3LGH5_9AGAR|nr:hypothetical protein BDQ12DRAFT_729215 [Crucibulum laeve]
MEVEEPENLRAQRDVPGKGVATASLATDLSMEEPIAAKKKTSGVTNRVDGATNGGGNSRTNTPLAGPPHFLEAQSSPPPAHPCSPSSCLHDMINESPQGSNNISAEEDEGLEYVDDPMDTANRLDDRYDEVDGEYEDEPEKPYGEEVMDIRWCSWDRKYSEDSDSDEDEEDEEDEQVEVLSSPSGSDFAEDCNTRRKQRGKGVVNSEEEAEDVEDEDMAAMIQEQVWGRQKRQGSRAHRGMTSDSGESEQSQSKFSCCEQLRHKGGDQRTLRQYTKDEMSEVDAIRKAVSRLCGGRHSLQSILAKCGFTYSLAQVNSNSWNIYQMVFGDRQMSLTELNKEYSNAIAGLTRDEIKMLSQKWIKEWDGVVQTSTVHQMKQILKQLRTLFHALCSLDDVDIVAMVTYTGEDRNAALESCFVTGTDNTMDLIHNRSVDLLKLQDKWTTLLKCVGSDMLNRHNVSIPRESEDENEQDEDFWGKERRGLGGKGGRMLRDAARKEGNRYLRACYCALLLEKWKGGIGYLLHEMFLAHVVCQGWSEHAIFLCCGWTITKAGGATMVFLMECLKETSGHSLVFEQWTADEEVLPYNDKPLIEIVNEYGRRIKLITKGSADDFLNECIARMNALKWKGKAKEAQIAVERMDRSSLCRTGSIAHPVSPSNQSDDNSHHSTGSDTGSTTPAVAYHPPHPSNNPTSQYIGYLAPHSMHSTTHPAVYPTALPMAQHVNHPRIQPSAHPGGHITNHCHAHLITCPAVNNAPVGCTQPCGTDLSAHPGCPIAS